MGTVGVIRRPAALCRCNNIRELLFVMLCKPICGGLRRSCLQIVQIPVLLLIGRQTIPHMVQYPLRELLRLTAGHILADPFRIQPCLVHPKEPDG